MEQTINLDSPSDSEMASLAADVFNCFEADPAHNDHWGWLEPTDINVTHCRAYGKHGHIATYHDGGEYVLKLGVNFDWWEKQSNTRRLVFLAHEYAHASDAHNERGKGGHTSHFWDMHMTHVREILASRADLEATWGTFKDWSLLKAMKDSVNPHIIDGRVETVDERRTKIMEDFYYDHL